jgi:hypothetical protein
MYCYPGFTLRMTYCDGSTNDFTGFDKWETAIAAGISRYTEGDGDKIEIIDGQGVVHSPDEIAEYENLVRGSDRWWSDSSYIDYQIAGMDHM